MLAKGHDFPAVTLVGVVGADATLGLPDFRAAERTFQLLAQMAGRSGRGETPGEVVMQAHQPEHYAIEAASAHDYERFYEQEIRFRQRLQYPPFSSMIACICRGKGADGVKEDADRLAAAVRREGGDDIRLLGPAPPLISRVRGRHRLQLLILGGDRDIPRGVLHSGLAALAAQRNLPRDLVIDVDPVSLL